MLGDRTATNILVVNHSADARHRAIELAAERGFVTHAASNAFEALFQLGAFPIDAVICEAELPGRDSKWLSERVTQLHPGTQFIVSPNGNGADWESALQRLLIPPPAETDTPATSERADDFDVDSSEPELVVPVEIDAADAKSQMDRRRARRFRPASKLAVALRGRREGLVHDISESGASIETSAHVGPHRTFELRFPGPETIRVTGQVVRCSVVAVRTDGVVYRLAVSFKTPLRETDVKRLVAGDDAP
jgi:CheY-like chemotaxis protein